jgi:nucleoside-diphosphate-sugar epimerase
LDSGRNVLITGGAGFLGCHLARRFLQEDYRVTLLDVVDLDAGDLLGRVRFVRADVRDCGAVLEAARNQDCVVHAAAALPIQQSKRAIYSVNVGGTRNVLEAALAHRARRVVYVSSTAVYGVPKQVPETERAPLDPIGYYGRSKLAAEKLCAAYARRGVSLNVLRPKTFLGPERLGVFEVWFEAIYRGRRVFLLGSGHNRYQLLAVSDVCDAILAACTSAVDGEVFNVGASEFGTWRSDLGYVIERAGSRARITGLPVRSSQWILAAMEALHLSPIAAWHYKTLPVDSYVAIEKAERLLGWRPRQSNRDLLWDSYRWYAQHHAEVIRRVGKTHRVGWDTRALKLMKILS